MASNVICDCKALAELVSPENVLHEKTNYQKAPLSKILHFILSARFLTGSVTEGDAQRSQPILRLGSLIAFTDSYKYMAHCLRLGTSGGQTQNNESGK
jgi:hypothetical protein